MKKKLSCCVQIYREISVRSDEIALTLHIHRFLFLGMNNETQH